MGTNDDGIEFNRPAYEVGTVVFGICNKCNNEGEMRYDGAWSKEASIYAFDEEQTPYRLLQYTHVGEDGCYSTSTFRRPL